jgi:hypothetical protein
MPRMALLTLTGCGGPTPKPLAWAVVAFGIVTGTKFIVGLPMKPATNILLGFVMC